MAKYSKTAGTKVETAMKEMKKGTLKTGSGKKVTDKKQAIAIGLSEAKQKGAKVPAKKAASKKAVAKKNAPQKTAAKKAGPTKKSVAPKEAAAVKSSPLQKVASPKKAGSVKGTSTKNAARSAKVTGSGQRSATKTAAPKKSAAPKKNSPRAQASKASIKADKASAAPANKKQVVRSTSKRAMQPEERDMPKPSPKVPEQNGITEPKQKVEDLNIPVQEPTRPAPEVSGAKGNPIPPDTYSKSGDNYHGHTNPTSSKSKMRPGGKKPLWN